MYLTNSYKIIKDLDIVTVKCLECEEERKYLREMLPTFEDNAPKVIFWNNSNLRRDLKFKVAQDEFRKLALNLSSKVTEEQAKQFALGLNRSCNRKEIK